MNPLVDAFEDLFTATAALGGKLAKTASFTLENVSWKDTPNQPEASSHPISDRYLEAACANSGQSGSSSNRVAQALLAVSNQLKWRNSSKSPDQGPDIVHLLRNFAIATIIGDGGLLPSDKVYSGFSLQAPDMFYPPHAHTAEESYFIIGGDADWRVGSDPWFAVKPGESVYHKSGVRHAMQTSEQPLLTIWLWTSHLDSEVLVLRD